MAIYETGVGTNYELAILATFRPVSHRSPETVQDKTKIAINH